MIFRACRSLISSKRKSAAYSHVRQLVALAERRTGEKVKHLSSGNGGKYSSAKLDSYVKQRGVVLEDTERYMQQQNRILE